MPLYLMMTIQENHKTDTFHLSPFKICGSKEEAIKTRVEGYSRFAVLIVDQNQSFDFSDLTDAWTEDEKVDGIQFIFYDKCGH